jgi:hypothetical protein
MKWEIKALQKRLDELAEKRPKGRPPLMTLEGEAWLAGSIEHLTEDESAEFKGIVERLSALDVNAPHWKDPAWQKVWDERMRLLHRFGELVKSGESRANADESDAYLCFETKFREDKTQFAKVHVINPSESQG